MNTSILRSNNATELTFGIAALAGWVIGVASASAPGAYPKHPR